MVKERETSKPGRQLTNASAFRSLVSLLGCMWKECSRKVFWDLAFLGHQQGSLLW